jgi:ribosomal protein S18 acetylase RimI-like enzyme
MNKEKQEIMVNGQKFILRPAEDYDFTFILNLLKENMLASFEKHWGEWNESSFEKTHRKKNIRIIDSEDSNKGHISSVGYIDFKFKIDCGYVNDIQLSEKIRGKGLGTYIMKLVEQETLDKGLNRICLKVFKDNRAVQLYQRLGYKPIFEDDTSLIMEKKL